MNLETDNKIQKKGITLVIPNPCGNIKETKMKNSGIEWIGEIPDDWEVKPVKRYFSHVKRIVGDDVDKYERLSLTMQCVLKRSKDDAEGLQPEKFNGYQILKQNELVFKLIDLENVNTSRVGISPFNGLVSPAYIILTNNKKDNTFYYYWFLNMYYQEIFNKLGDGGVRSALNASDVLSLPMVYLNNETQQCIASYLDKKCSKIEETIQNQQQVIEKLKAYKQSQITEAVTGKKYHENCHTDSIMLTQNPNEDMKTEIPLGISNPCDNIEFKYCNLGFIADFKNGLNYNASDFGTEVRFLGVGDFQNYLVLNDESMFSNIITDTEIEDDYYLKNGDIIFVRSNGSKELVGRAIMVDNIDFKVTYSGFCIRLRNKEPKKINSKFLLYFFRSDYFRNELQRLSQGSNISNINQDLLSHIKIPLVDIRFQESVVDFLNKKCTAIDTAIEQKQNLIEKLTEYKKSLIYECVTGKKEI